MHLSEDHAMKAVWDTELESHYEKLVICHLAAKHELGDRYSSAWKPLDQFIAEFQDRWCNLHELEDATHLSKVKLERALAGLVARDLVKVSQRPAKVGKRKKLLEGEVAPTEQVVTLTAKIFSDYKVTGSAPVKKQSDRRQSA